MKRLPDIIYFTLLMLILIVLLANEPAHSQTFSSEKYVVTIGTTQQYGLDSAGFKNAVTRAQVLTRRYNTRITIVVMPGVASIGNSYVILPDSVDWFWMPSVKITGSHADAVIKDTAAVTVKWAGTPEVINTTDSTKTIVLNGATELNYLYSVASDGDTTLNPLNITSITSGDLLQWDGSSWENVSLSTAGIQAFDADLTTYAGITPSANIQTLLGAADYSAMRTQLSLTIGTNVQAYDADLTTYAGITPSVNVQTLLGASDYSAMRTQLALTIGTNVQAYDADLTTYAGITPSANVQTLLGSADYSAFKTSLSLNNVTNESKATMFTAPTFTGVTTTAALTTVAVDFAHTSSRAIDWSTSNVFCDTIDGLQEITFTNAADRQIITVLIVRKSTDSEVTFTDASLEWPTDTEPINGTGFGRDIYSFIKIGDKIYGTMLSYVTRTW